MLHQNALQAACIHELEEQLAVVTRRKARKRKRLQHRGTLEYGKAADQVAASTALVANPSKKTRSGSAPERAPSTRRRCGTCGETGHNARTCQKDTAVSSESEASTQYIFSDSSDNENNSWSQRVRDAKTFWPVRWFDRLGGGIRYYIIWQLRVLLPLLKYNSKYINT
jgi:hypothetical protein